MVAHVHQQARYTTRRLRRYVVHGVSLDIAREYAYLIDLLDVHHLGGHFGFLLGGRLLDIAALRTASYARHANAARKQRLDNITLHTVYYLSCLFFIGFPARAYSAPAVDVSSSIM